MWRCCLCFFGLCYKHFKGTLALYGIVIFAVDAALLYDVQPLSLGYRANLRQREEHLRAFHHRRCALLVKEADQRLARLKVHYGLVGLEGRVGTERVGSRLNGFLVLWRIGTQGVLHAVAKLSEDVLRYVRRALGDEVYSHAL